MKILVGCGCGLKCLNSGAGWGQTQGQRLAELSRERGPPVISVAELSLARGCSGACVARGAPPAARLAGVHGELIAHCAGAGSSSPVSSCRPWQQQGIGQAQWPQPDLQCCTAVPHSFVTDVQPLNRTICPLYASSVKAIPSKQQPFLREPTCPHPSDPLVAGGLRALMCNQHTHTHHSDA